VFKTPLLLAAFTFSLICSAICSPHCSAQAAGETTQGPTADSSVIDANGTARITRVVRLPSVLSPEARARWSKPVPDTKPPETTAQQRRPGIDAWQKAEGQRAAAAYPVKMTDGTVAGVPVRIIDPLPGQKAGPVSGAGSAGDALHYSVIEASAGVGSGRKPASQPVRQDRVLICLHGGGFDSDTGSYTEAIPIANLTRTRVVSVLYRLAPEHPYPAAVEDAVAVYQAMLKKYPANRIAIYGTSAGAILTGEVAVRLKQLHLPEPGALGVFSGGGDLTGLGDSGQMYTFDGLGGYHDVPEAHPTILPAYVGKHDPHDPVLSPNRADLHGLPPTLFITSGRDILLSGTADMERAWLRDGVPSQMVLFDGLPHYFWGDVDLPESREAFATMARFFDKELGSK
jgi:monoterpene epsilon-lactone hydrolase